MLKDTAGADGDEIVNLSHDHLHAAYEFDGRFRARPTSKKSCEAARSPWVQLGEISISSTLVQRQQVPLGPHADPFRLTDKFRPLLLAQARTMPDLLQPFLLRLLMRRNPRPLKPVSPFGQPAPASVLRCPLGCAPAVRRLASPRFDWLSTGWSRRQH